MFEHFHLQMCAAPLLLIASGCLWQCKRCFVSDVILLLFSWYVDVMLAKVVDKKKISDIPQWFDGCRLNYAENLLRHRDDRVALYGLREYVCCHS